MNERFEHALAVRRSVLGNDYVDAVMAQGGSFGAQFQEFVTRVCWGEAWLEEDLDMKTRSLVTLAIVAALGQRREIELHFGGALRNGCSETELAAVLKHVALYAGMGAAAQAFALAENELQRFASEGSDPGQHSTGDSTTAEDQQ